LKCFVGGHALLIYPLRSVVVSSSAFGSRLTTIKFAQSLSRVSFDAFLDSFYEIAGRNSGLSQSVYPVALLRCHSQTLDFYLSVGGCISQLLLEEFLLRPKSPILFLGPAFLGGFSKKPFLFLSRSAILCRLFGVRLSLL